MRARLLDKCIAPNCERDAKGHSYCNAHLMRLKKFGDLNLKPYKKIKKCKIENCCRDVSSNGMCPKHNSEFARHGSVSDTKTTWGRKPPLTKTHPQLAAQMIVGDPNLLTFGSVFIATWRCSCGNEWQSKVCWRTNNGSKSCPTCARIDNAKKYKGSAYHKGKIFKPLSKIRPDLAAHAVFGLPDLSTVGRESGLQVLWQCPDCPVTYWSSIRNRTHCRTGCPDCTKGSFRRNQLGWVYLIARPGQLKIGITNTVNGTGIRLRRHGYSGWTQLDMIGPMHGEMAHQLELRIKHELDAKGIPRGDKAFMGRFDGYTEAWQTVDLDVSTLRGLFEHLGIDEGKYHATRQETDKERSHCNVADSTERIAGGGAQVLDTSVQSHSSVIGHGSGGSRRRGANHGRAPARPRRGDATGSSQRTFHYA